MVVYQLSRKIIRFLIACTCVLLPSIICAALEDPACEGMSMFNKMVSGCGDGAIFTPGRSDLSLEYLRLIFGSVSTALHGASNQLVGEMFRIFNLGILVVTGSLISYTVFSSVMGAAQDGGAMQGGKVSPWVTIRIVSGTSLLLPTFNGYSGIQVMVMYAVVQGVGFANSAWSTALDYMQQTGQSLEVHQTFDAYEDAKKLLPLIQTMSESAVCLEAFKSACTVAQNFSPDCPSQSSSILAGQAFSLQPDYSTYTLNFGSSKVAAYCGSIGVSNVDAPYGKSIIFSSIQSAANLLLSEAQSYVRQKAADPSVDISGSFEMAMVTAANTITGATNLVRMESDKSSGDANNLSFIPHAQSRGWITAGMYYRDLLSKNGYTECAALAKDVNGKCQASGPAFQVYASQSVNPSTDWASYDNPNAYAKAYTGFMSGVAKANAASASAELTALSNASQVYSDPAEVQEYNSVANQITSRMKQMTDKNSYSNARPSGTADGFQDMSKAAMIRPLYNLMAVITGMTEQLMGVRIIDSSSQKYGVNPSDLTDALESRSLCGAASNCADSAGSCGQLSTGNGCLLPYGLLGGIYIDKRGGNYDPLVGVTTAGQLMMAYAVGYWVETTKLLYDDIINATTALFGASLGVQLPLTAAAAAIYGENPFGAGALAATGELIVSTMKMFYQIAKVGMEMYVPLGSALASVVFGLGVVMGIYIPFLPFLLFLFGVIGWIMAVIEAIVAAPLVALGVTHPEGHDLLGKAEQSLMLILGVFVRPITMILGLFFSIQLASITIKLFNHGFLFVASNFLSTFMDNTSGADGYSLIIQSIGFIGLVMVYAYVLMTILEQAYSLIYQIPDKILRWIGGPQESAGSVKQMVDQIKGQISQMGQSVGQAGSSITKSPEISAHTAKGMEYKNDKSKGGAGGE